MSVASKARLRKPAEFKAVFAEAKRFSRGALTVLVRPNGGDTARLGLAVSKRNARRAVDRNRIKRVVRESFRSSRLRLGGIDVVVLTRPGIVRMTKPALRGLIDQHWNRIVDCGLSEIQRKDGER